MLRQSVNTYLSMALVASVALGASFIIIKASQIPPYQVNSAEYVNPYAKDSA